MLGRGSFPAYGGLLERFRGARNPEPGARGGREGGFVKRSVRGRDAAMKDRETRETILMNRAVEWYTCDLKSGMKALEK